SNGDPLPRRVFHLGQLAVAVVLIAGDAPAKVLRAEDTPVRVVFITIFFSQLIPHAQESSRDRAPFKLDAPAMRLYDLRQQATGCVAPALDAPHFVHVFPDQVIDGPPVPLPGPVGEANLAHPSKGVAVYLGPAAQWVSPGNGPPMSVVLIQCNVAQPVGSL